jgi:flavin reductase (DIM6/NTAB) family NADH-FMN oxidoreductase RutF
MFEQYNVEDVELNPFTTIGDESFLITVGSSDKWNTMTGGWGFFGYMWKKPALSVVVRPTRYTYEFLEKYDHFTVSFFPPTYAEALQICGSHSGRDTDKIELAGLTPTYIDHRWITFEEANMVYCCSKASKTFFESSDFIDPAIEELYPLKDYHAQYIGFIEQMLIKE